MNVRLTTVISALALVALACPLAAQSTQFDLGIGYQWLNVDGNKDVYRSQAGMSAGLLLDTLDFVLTDTTGNPGYDQLRISAGGVGASPDTRFRLEVGRNKMYSLKISYLRSEVFEALPDVANPFLAQGVVPGQHTMNRHRDSLNIDLALLPGEVITPLIGYTRSAYSGLGQTTYHVGEDEFRLNSNLDETSDELRAGVAFSAGGFHGAVIEGWRHLTSDTLYELVPGAGEGNNTRPVLGEDVFASYLAGQDHTKVSTPFTNVYVTGNIVDRVRLVASYARTDGEVDANGTGDVRGQLASFVLRRFYTGANETVQSSADNPSWRGEARAEVEIVRGLDFLASYTDTHRELDGRSLITDYYTGTVNFSGMDPKDIQKVIDARTAWQRDEKTVEGRLVVHPINWLRFWGSAARVSQDVTITPAAAEIVISGAQGGSYDRDIDRYQGGVGLDFGFLSLGAEYLKDDANNVVVATDYTDRERWRGRVGFRLGSILHLTGTGERIEYSNPDPNIDLAAKITHWAAELDVTPLEALDIHAGYDKYNADSSQIIRRPQDFGLEQSVYLEDGEDVEGSISAHFGTVKIDFGGNKYTNEGDLAFDLKRGFARLDVGLSKAVGVYGQWERRRYDEKALPAANYEGDRYGVFLRWSGQ
jgi:hypothetical protein